MFNDEELGMLSKQLGILAVVCLLFSNSAPSQAKDDGNEQDEIILLNDSAAALEDSNPGLSKRLTQFADEMEKDWEEKNANKAPAIVLPSKKDFPIIEQRIKILQAASLAIGPTYPLIAKSLQKIIKEMDRTIENEQ